MPINKDINGSNFIHVPDIKIQKVIINYNDNLISIVYDLYIDDEYEARYCDYGSLMYRIHLLISNEVIML